MVGGYAGQLSAGHAAFVGIGGYTAALLSDELGLTPVDRHVRGRRAGRRAGRARRLPGLPVRPARLLLRAADRGLRRGVPHLALNTDAVGGALGLYITFTGNPRQFQFQDNRAYYYLALG